MPEYVGDYTIEEVFSRVVAAADRMRQVSAANGGYNNNKDEDGDGLLLAFHDGPKDELEQEIYVEPDAVMDQQNYRADKQKFDAVKEQLEQEGVSDETMEQYMDLYRSQLEEHVRIPIANTGPGEDNKIGGTYWEKHGEPVDLRDYDVYREIAQTFRENDGAGIGGTDGLSDVLYYLPPLKFEGSAKGAKEKALRGFVENQIYNDEGEELGLYMVAVKETNGDMYVTTPETDGLIRYSLRQQIEQPADWAEMQPYTRTAEMMPYDDRTLHEWLAAQKLDDRAKEQEPQPEAEETPAIEM